MGTWDATPFGNDNAADAGYARSLDPWPRVARPLPEQLLLKSAEVLDRMQEAEENELVERWRETESYSEFVGELTSLRSYFP